MPKWIILKTIVQQKIVSTQPESKMVFIRKGRSLSMSSLLSLQPEVIYSVQEDGKILGEEEVEITTERTFKTEYAKEKYLRRHKERKSGLFSFSLVTPFSLSVFYLSKGRLFGIETLGRLLHLANVSSHGNYLVHEENGFISGSILYQTHGLASVTSCGVSSSRVIVDLLLDGQSPISYTERTSLEILTHSSSLLFDAVIFCLSSPSQTTILLELSSCVRPSGALIVYSDYKELLHPLYTYLQNNPEYIDYKLLGCFQRKYQHQGGLFHPEINTNQYGGYLVSAFRVFPE